MSLAPMIIDHKPRLEIITPRATTQIFFPDLEAARQAVLQSYETLPTASTKERFSQRDCEYRCELFMRFLRSQDIKVPDKKAMDAYVGHMRRKGLSGATIQTYLVYARHICRELADQLIHPEIEPEQYRYANEVRRAAEKAARYPNPKMAPKRKVGGAYAKGKRLTQEEAQTILDFIDTSTLHGLRDAALLLAGFVTGLRISELSRITLDAIQEYAPGKFKVTVRAKGSKEEPRAIDRSAVDAIRTYVDAYNSELDKSDPRRIKSDQPVWMPLTRTGRIFKNVRGPMSTRGLSNIITKRSSAPGEQYAIKAHDLRRTWAANAERLGMKPEDIQEQMLHNTLQQTREYIARPKDISSQNIVAAGFKLELK